LDHILPNQSYTKQLATFYLECFRIAKLAANTGPGNSPNIRQTARLKKRSGLPDVVAWKPVNPIETVYFIECKHRGAIIGQIQEDWISTAVQIGLNPNQFALVVLDIKLVKS